MAVKYSSVPATARASSARDITADGALTFEAHADGSSEASDTSARTYTTVNLRAEFRF